MSSGEFSRLYDAYYYAHDCGPPYERTEEWLSFFASVADRIVTDMRPATVLDVGCAMGFLVEGLRRRGVEAYGVDISEYAIEKVDPSIRPYCWVGSAVETFPRKYDLIVCIEVLEHIPQSKADEAVKNCCFHTDRVLFSSTPFDHQEITHLNVQPPEYWAELFARHSFFRDVDFDASFINPWAVCFRRKNEPVQSIVKDYERKYWLLWKGNVDLRQSKLELSEMLKAQVEQEQEIHRSLSWQLMQRGQRFCLRLAPSGSRRNRWLTALIRILVETCSEPG